LRTVKYSLLECYENGSEINARAGMSFASLTSGICLANAGLGAVHGFASSIGGLYDVPHGLICGTLMAVTNELTLRKLLKTGSGITALKKYATLGEIFTGGQNKSVEEKASEFITYLHELTGKLNLPGLNKSGVRVNDFPEICRNTGMKNNPVKLDEADLTEILERRLT
jgi:alcohol dehydrogenase class IV